MRRNGGHLTVPHGTFAFWILSTFPKCEGAAVLFFISLYLKRVKDGCGYDFWGLRGIQAVRTVRTVLQACICQGSAALCFVWLVTYIIPQGPLSNLYGTSKKGHTHARAHFCSRVTRSCGYDLRIQQGIIKQTFIIGPYK